MKITVPRMLFFILCEILVLLILGVCLKAATEYHDVRIGHSAFRILVVRGQAVMQPVVSPTFKLQWLEGPKLTTDEVRQCAIYARRLEGVNPLENTELLVTVLRCGDSAYGIQEVDFALEDEKR